MEPFSAASILAIAGKLVTAEVTKAAVAGAKSQLQPDKMALVLKQSIESAQATQPETGGLFFRCQSKAAKEFLEQFFKSDPVVKELQKPLQDDGKPDVDILVVAFDRSAKQHSAMQDYIPDSLRPWIEKFVDSYFEQIQGIPFQVAKAQYLEQLARRVDDVKFVGIAVPGEEVEKQEILAQIFVMPDVREESNRKLDIRFDPELHSSWGLAMRGGISFNAEDRKTSTNQSSLLEEQKEWAMRDRSTPRIPAPKILNLSQKKAVVLGAPGSGKTMLVSYFALMLCETSQSDPTQIGLDKDNDYLPVVVRIRDWILQPKMGLLEYLEYYAKTNLCTKELPTGFFEHWLERGRALILLDGLDEVVDEAQRRKVAEQIETFLHRYQSNPAVITSRPAGYRWDFFNLDEFPHYTLESFDDKQVATFIDHWYDNRENDKEKATRRKADLQSAFARNERIWLLAKNPLLLTIITLIHRYGGELPKQRCELYEAAVKTLLIKWDSGKEIKRYEQDLIYLKHDDLLYILKKLAYWIHTKGSVGETEGGTIIKKNDLIGQLRKEIQARTTREFDEAEEEAKRFIDFIRQRTGLLNEQEQDRYAFVHKTFQEYLTAEEIYYLANREDDTNIILDHFRAHLHDQHWREVLLLLVSRLEGHKARKAIKTVLDANSEYEQWLHRDLLFAGWCLTEDPPELTMVAGDLVGEILDRLVGLEVEKSDQIGRNTKREVEKILHCFGETSLEQGLLAKWQSLEGQIDCVVFLALQAALGQEANAVKRLLSLLNDEDLSVCIHALGALGDLGNTNPLVTSELLLLLHNEDFQLKPVVISVLGDLRNANSAVIDSLLSLLDNRDGLIIHSAAQALYKLGNYSAEVMYTMAIISQMQQRSIDDYIPPVSLLDNVKTEEELQKIVGKCLVSLGDKDIYIQIQGVKLLDEIARSGTKFVSKLLSQLSDENLNLLVSWLRVPYSDEDVSVSTRSILIRLAKETISPKIMQWLEQNPNDDEIGYVIDCLWSIVVE